MKTRQAWRRWLILGCFAALCGGPAAAGEGRARWAEPPTAAAVVAEPAATAAKPAAPAAAAPAEAGLGLDLAREGERPPVGWFVPRPVRDKGYELAVDSGAPAGGPPRPAQLRRALAGAASDRDEHAFLATLERLVAALGDGHGSVNLTSSVPALRLPLLWEWVEDQLVVTDVQSDHAAGVHRGDVVTAIDGKPVRDAIAAEEELISAATPQWRRYRALHTLLAGTAKTARLGLRRADGTTTTVDVERSLPASGPGALEEHRPDKIAELAPGVWYVDPGRATDDDWNAALPRLAQARGIVFDMRGYPKMTPAFLQHLTAAPLASAQWRVPVVMRPDRDGLTFYTVDPWRLEPLAPRLTAKLAFLVDGRAISYAESCLGIVEHYRLGEILGSPTAGTNGDVDPFRLPGHYYVSWTGMQVLKQDGSRHHGVGLQPTIPVSRTVAGIRQGRDEVLERGIAVVSR